MAEREDAMHTGTACATLLVLTCLVVWADAPEITSAGGLKVSVGPGEVEIDGKTITVRPVTLIVHPPEMATVTDERHSELPVYNPDAPPWLKGQPLLGVWTQETTAADMLDPESVVVRPEGGGAPYTRGADYEYDSRWGTLGRLEGGAIAPGATVLIDYRYGLCRIDSLIADLNGAVDIVPGTPHVNVPRPTPPPPGCVCIANLWIPGRLAEFGAANIFPITSSAYVPPERTGPSVAETLLPETLRKLREGEHLKILAWGDSVTVGTFVPDWETNRWQEQFVARLRARFPRAEIELVTAAWGGRATQSFMDEPPGSPYNYQEQVLGAKPDLVVSEFVNDAYLDQAGVDSLYGKVLADFQAIGAEWIIQTPHYVRPDWMGLASERDCDDDPRPYVAAIRNFAASHDVALADASLRWGHLWREGIPYTTLLLNSINHPDERGMALFADALMELFPEE